MIGQRSALKVWCNDNLAVKIIVVNHSDNRCIYGDVAYRTRSTYANETGQAGAVVREVEERFNGVVSCPVKQRTGKKLFYKYYG